MGYKRCDTISDATGLGVIFIIICRRCHRLRRVAALHFSGFMGGPNVHRETAISDLRDRLVCRGEGDVAGCGHRGAFLYMTLPEFPQVSDDHYLRRAMEEATRRRRGRGWR